MTKIYLFAKQIHNYLVIIIAIVGIFMAETGMVLKFPNLSHISPIFDYELSRNIHNQLSAVFSILFILMAITGLIMFIFPHLKKRK